LACSMTRGPLRSCVVISRCSGRVTPMPARRRHRRLIYDIFEGTAEIQQLVVSRAISGMQIR